MNVRIKREIEEYPERFDYADIPAPDRLSKEYVDQMDKRRPSWVIMRHAKQSKPIW